jgi:transcriptional regulator with XRE-family HTH domain
MPSPRPGPSTDATSDPTVRLAAKLQQLREQAGKSLKELESEVHASDSSLSRYFSGRAVPPWSVVERLSDLAARDSQPLRQLWEEASRSRRSPAESSADPPGQEPTGEPVPPPASWRTRHRRLLLAAAFVTTAVLFAASGFAVGSQFAVRVVTLKPTEDQACASWPWPANTGVPFEQPVHPTASNHTPTIQLLEGKATDGRAAVWAEISGAGFGDRVWLDWSTDSGKTWTQCGPFPVTTDSGTTRAHDLTPGSLFRACGDIPQPLSVPGERSEICTQYH